MNFISRDWDDKVFFPMLLCLILLLPLRSMMALQSILMSILFFLWIYAIYTSKETILVRTSLDFPLLAFLFWSSLSLIWTADFKESFVNVIALWKQIFLFYFILTMVRCQNDFLKILLVFLLALVAIDCFAITEFFIRGGSLLNRHVRAGDIGSFNYDYLTMFVVMFLPLTVLFMIYVKGRNLKLLFGIASLLSIVALYLGYTRAGWITVIFQFLTFAWFYSKKMFKYSLIGLIGAFIFGYFLFISLKTYNESQNSAETQIHADTLNPDNMKVRVTAWKFGLKAILQRPLTGFGFGSDIFRIVNEKQNKNIVDATVNLHNTFFEILYELGAVGLILFCICLFKLLKESIGGFRTARNPFHSFYHFYMILMTAGLLVKNLFYHLFNGAVAEIFWVLAGLLYALKNIDLES